MLIGKLFFLGFANWEFFFFFNLAKPEIDVEKELFRKFQHLYFTAHYFKNEKGKKERENKVKTVGLHE